MASSPHIVSSSALMAWFHRCNGRLPAGFMVMNERRMRAELSHYLGHLWRFGIVLSRDSPVAAERLVEQTCMRALEREPLLFCSQRMDCWLFSILHSVWFNEYHSHSCRPGQHNDNNRVSLGNPAVGPHICDGAELVSQVMELPDTYRATVFLAYVEGMSYREVAEVLALPIDTVINALTDARVLLAGSTRLANESQPGEAV